MFRIWCKVFNLPFSIFGRNEISDPVIFSFFRTQHTYDLRYGDMFDFSATSWPRPLPRRHGGDRSAISWRSFTTADFFFFLSHTRNGSFWYSSRCSYLDIVYLSFWWSDNVLMSLILSSAHQCQFRLEVRYWVGSTFVTVDECSSRVLKQHSCDFPV